MFRNYLIIAWRNIIKHKTFSFINIGGLAVGITAVFLIGIYIQTEMHYDDFHVKGKQIYRASFEDWQKETDLGSTEEFVAAFAPDAKNELTGIKEFCRIGANNTAYFSADQQKLKVEKISYADSSFFKIFSFKLLAGNPNELLKNPYSVVLNETTASKLFGNKNAIGKAIKLNGKDNYIVTGIVANAPANSHIQFNSLISFSTLYKDSTNFMGWNGGNQYATYFLLDDAKQFERQLPDFMWRHLNKELTANRGIKIDAHLQPLNKIHLQYSSDSENTKTNFRVFAIIAFLILCVSCINYINLSVAQATARFKEVGVRKVLGAKRKQLIKQFLGESFFVTLIALFIALLLVYLLLPVYRQLLGNELYVTGTVMLAVVLMMIVVILIISAGAGGYIAFYLSSLNPVATLQKAPPKSSRQLFGKVLIVFQFAVTTALMSCTLIVFLQLNYIKNKPVGFDKEKIIVLPLVGNEVQDKAVFLKQQLNSLSDIQNISSLSEMPYDGITNNGFVAEGSNDVLLLHQLDVDEDFLKTFHITLVSGNFFSKEKLTDASGYVINQTLANQLGWKNPLGKTIARNGTHHVIGVINDFNFASLHNKIEPLIITVHPWLNRYGYLAVHYNGEHPAALMQQIKTLWSKTFTDAPFDYWFLDNAFDELYRSEIKFRELFFCFSILSIALSLSGIFGLVLLNIKNRTKEIGIRKVMGAGIADIVGLTSKSFFYLIIGASLIAIPFARYYMNNWLQNFAYRINMQWWMFAVSGITVLFFALLVISLQAIKAAIANPVKSLRTE